VRWALLVAVTVALGMAAVAVAATPMKARLTTSTTRPVVGQPWHWKVTVRSATGAPLRARVRLQILLAETVVGCWKGRAMVQCSGRKAGDWLVFRGKRAGVLTWPAESVGPKLMFQAVVTARRQTKRLRAPVTVQPAPVPTP
jgi:hypothetical protein